MKQALISVSDKTGIVELAKGLVENGISIISTGGTAKTLKDNKINVTEISGITGFKEILDGRVKTLHPIIFGGILAQRNDKHLKELKDHNINTIDIVVVNLYPFEQTITKELKQDSEIQLSKDIIENIDIGGVALLRAAAKNHESVVVVCDSKDYGDVLEHIIKNDISPEFKRKLAAKAFRHTAYYDSMISGCFTQEKFPETFTVGMRKICETRYGENPHQKAALYEVPDTKYKTQGVVDAKQLHGKELSYNNYLDLESAWSLVNEFDTTACVIVKHNNPCGVALGDTVLSAYKNALLCDPVSAFGGIIAINREVDKDTAVEIVKLFTECIIAPEYTEEAKKTLSAKKDLRLLELPVQKLPEKIIDIRSISRGMLVQDRDTLVGQDNLKVSTKRKPTEEELKSLIFAWKVGKNVKSNAIILVRGTQAVGIGAGQMSRIDSIKIAHSKMNEIPADKLPETPLVLASDAFFPFPDVVEEAVKIKVTAIIQPGGSLGDEKSIDVCDKNNITMVFTGIRHFRH
ncbi:MAG: bifunctional phosphoribosylaminoimidazolecarboxamide formyltransferase/IMP cyclohydrolase [Elusimicrobia bacterium CG1_02_37_114]|nr:MAG: bifunctional phosphoribosylaminoimidazolecarboxamide formyltransferase/IMP cyclohydrolase [Elusimicrobia bacterium CG1_02_37_114]PIV54163.1 MAG: bifunctional phosphoribosylaminoimidazolecarboxamide formyltransferase/inosine monophosphate cyclohydrolase [Elusimicrobia bacterium CG02_land_8_20_14_3_00_37_13]PIZ13939.1 MAG: bifunctional phosphoribosylaminoimidazolecarboxamide formyltransferase/inosine monophosphate cyclohydrolase [Elusimicrobia bacterium CG_4_10_14_0_8_um_filter_37_32]